MPRHGSGASNRGERIAWALENRWGGDAFASSVQRPASSVQGQQQQQRQRRQRPRALQSRVNGEVTRHTCTTSDPHLHHA
jgi:hypothetical protein